MSEAKIRAECRWEDVKRIRALLGEQLSHVALHDAFVSRIITTASKKLLRNHLGELACRGITGLVWKYWQEKEPCKPLAEEWQHLPESITDQARLAGIQGDLRCLTGSAFRDGLVSCYENLQRWAAVIKEMAELERKIMAWCSGVPECDGIRDLISEAVDRCDSEFQLGRDGSQRFSSFQLWSEHVGRRLDAIEGSARASSSQARRLSLSSLEKRILKLLSRSEGNRLRSKAVAQELDLALGTVGSPLSRLRQAGLIENAGRSGYWITEAGKKLAKLG